VIDNELAGFISFENSFFDLSDRNPRTIHAFIDTDGNPLTGYRIEGMGADGCLKITVERGRLNIQYTGIDVHGNSIGPSFRVRHALSNTGIEFAIEGVLTEQKTPSMLPVTMDARGQFHMGYSPVFAGYSRSVPAFFWVAKPVVTEGDVLATITNINQDWKIQGVMMYFPNENERGQNLSLHIGVWPETSFYEFDMGDARRGKSFWEFDFPVSQTTLDLWICGDTVLNMERAIKFSLLALHTEDLVIPVAEKIPGGSYIEMAPLQIHIDGAFGDWIVGDRVQDPLGDAPPGTVDLIYWDARAQNTLNLYAEGATSLFNGLPGRPPRTEAVHISGLADSDRDGIPDIYDAYPYDFNNDGIPDSESFVIIDGIAYLT